MACHPRATFNAHLWRRPSGSFSPRGAQLLNRFGLCALRGATLGDPIFSLADTFGGHGWWLGGKGGRGGGGGETERRRQCLNFTNNFTLKSFLSLHLPHALGRGVTERMGHSCLLRHAPLSQQAHTHARTLFLHRARAAPPPRKIRRAALLRASHLGRQGRVWARGRHA